MTNNVNTPVNRYLPSGFVDNFTISKQFFLKVLVLGKKKSRSL
jgi:hypothetical protein